MTNGKITRHFASGSNRAGEIRGLTAAGWNVGVAAHEVHGPSAVTALNELKDSDNDLFYDNGAFSEVKVNSIHKCGDSKKCKAGKCIGNGKLPRPEMPEGAIYVHKPITDAEWAKRIAGATRMVDLLGSRCFPVAPDRVASQKVTLERLKKYAFVVRSWRKKGANVIVPIQKGDVSMNAFDKKVAAVLGFNDYIRGIPCCKDATKASELAVFTSALKKRGVKCRLHILGKGPVSDGFDKYLAALNGYEATTDAVDICRLAVRGGKKKDKKTGKVKVYKSRALTMNCDAIRIANGLPLPTSGKKVPMPVALYAEAVRRTFVDERERIEGKGVKLAA